MITQDLGIATAYGYAKSKGYTGTEAEFAELMASYASTAQTAIEAADRAVEANTAAQSAKTNAQASKTAAQTAAQTATTKASEAVTAAGTATTKASEASQSASTASNAATSASTSAQTATTAASTATTKASEAAVSANTATTAKTDAEAARDAAAQSASEAAASAESIDPETLEHKAYGAYVVESASGAVTSFADGADNIPMKDVLVHIEPVQEGSGDPSPDNVRPITGWTGANVTRTGKNLFDQSDTTFLSRDTRSYGNSDIRALAQINRLPAGTYTLSFIEEVVSLNENEPTATRFGLYLRAISGEQAFNVIAQTGLITPTVGQIITKTVTFTLTDEYVGKFQYFYVYTGKNDSYGAPNEYTCNIHDVQLELGSTATDYEPYSGQTYDTTFPSEAGTVYGGTLDVTKGELVVDRAQIASYNGEALPSTWISDCDVYASGTTPTIGAQVVYKLASPITYTLTPQEITSLLGTNNLWADTGDSDVEYRADTALYISRLTEPDADMIADANIVSGQYFTVGNNLYRATSNIASGASVVVGTNAVKVSLATALNEINQ